MTDRADWNIEDKNWLAQRKLKWPVFEKYFRDRMVGEEPYLTNDFVDVARHYYFGETVDQPSYEDEGARLGFVARIFLHPNPSVENIRSLVDEYEAKGYEKIDYSYLRVPSGDLSKFVSQELVDKDIIKNYMVALFGCSFGEALTLRGVDKENDLGKVFYDLVAAVNGWINNLSRSYGDRTPIDEYLVQFFGACEIVKNEHVEDADWSVKKLFKTLKIFENRDSAHIEGAQKAVATLRQTLKERKDCYCSSLQAFIEEIP